MLFDPCPYDLRKTGISPAFPVSDPHALSQHDPVTACLHSAGIQVLTNAIERIKQSYMDIKTPGFVPAVERLHAGMAQTHRCAACGTRFSPWASIGLHQCKTHVQSAVLSGRHGCCGATAGSPGCTPCDHHTNDAEIVGCDQFYILPDIGPLGLVAEEITARNPRAIVGFVNTLDKEKAMRVPLASGRMCCPMELPQFEAQNPFRRILDEEETGFYDAALHFVPYYIIMRMPALDRVVDTFISRDL